MNYHALRLFLELLESCKNKLTNQQFRTLRWLALGGDLAGAEKGLYRLLQY
jgi:hypothetical protein